MRQKVETKSCIYKGKRAEGANNFKDFRGAKSKFLRGKRAEGAKIFRVLGCKKSISKGKTRRRRAKFLRF